MGTQAKFSIHDYDTAVNFVRQAGHRKPKIGVILGSGMADIADEIVDKVSIPYSDIPNFPRTSAPGHKGTLHLGTLAGVDCVVMQGRFHLYEGFEPEDVVFPVRVIQRLGAGVLVATNAAGGVHPDSRVGDLVLVEDHINIAALAGLDPTRGENRSTFGSRFTPLNGAYDRVLLERLEAVSNELKLSSRRGVYGFACGPCFETPAEVRFMRMIGVDAVGMSTLPEVLAARHAGMRVAVISAITNVAIHDTSAEIETTEEEVWENAPAILADVSRLLLRFLPSIDSDARA